MTLPAPIRSRTLGSFFGLLTGDALGAPYEFRARDTYSVTSNLEPSHTFASANGGKALPAGSWTDDSSMALCVAESVLACGGWDAADCVGRWIRWMEEGYLSSTGKCFDIGNATRQALTEHSKHLLAHGALPSPLISNPERHIGGNGSIMRLGPLPLLSVHLQSHEACNLARASSLPTHASPLCTDACALLAGYIYAFVRSPGAEPAAQRKARVLSLSAEELGVGRLETPEVRELLEGPGWRTKGREEIKTSGYVVSTLEAALWALWRFASFEEGMMELLRMGSDVDTVCAVYGQAAGACYGIEEVPGRWVDGLVQKDMLDGVARRMLDFIEERWGAGKGA